VILKKRKVQYLLQIPLLKQANRPTFWRFDLGMEDREKVVVTIRSPPKNQFRLARSYQMAVVVSPTELQILEDCLLNKSNNVALHTRFRALFTLKSLKSEDAVNIISKGLSRIISP
jgi:hypothetical protein